MLANRIEKHGLLSKSLAKLSDIEMTHLLKSSQSNHSGIGGNSHVLVLDGIKMFVKKIPVTDIELECENHLSTKNIFNLPCFYQYGVGSTGFGIWREIQSHLMATEWVVDGDCTNFPLLHHWRILPKHTAPSVHLESSEKIDRDVAYWDDNASVRNRLETLQKASSEAVLFLEYIPENLHHWLSRMLAKDDDTASQAVHFVEAQLNHVNHFLTSRNFIHFDAHFENLLADGSTVYYSDFGLSVSKDFDLSPEEKTFFKTHRSYDQYSTMINLLHTIITHFYGKNQWTTKLHEYLSGNHEKLPDHIDVIIRKYNNVALTMDKFYQALQKESKLTPYPFGISENH